MTDPSRVRISGPLEPFLSGFATELARQGYTPRSLLTQLNLLSHVSRWLHARDLDVGDLPERARRFLEARQDAGLGCQHTRPPAYTADKQQCRKRDRAGQR